MIIYTYRTSFNADTYTPVKLYLSLRNSFRKTCLLESNDYHSRQDSKSFIGLEPIVEIKLENDRVSIIESGKVSFVTISSNRSLADQLQEILNDFRFELPQFNGFFGRIGFELTRPDETHLPAEEHNDTPLLHLFIFKYVVVIDHFTNEGTVLTNSTTEEADAARIEDILSPQAGTELPFELLGNERALFTDHEFSDKVERAIEHCRQGDVFQLVLSNAFQQSFFGDDFQVYRQLRRLNPSPYLFYFDFEEYRLFGSSPEAQLIIQNGIAEIHPIAGTIPKTGIEETDRQQLEFLLTDEKENAEHTMLVDLARNDLSRGCTEVQVPKYKEVQSFSHVTHLVSRVTGKLNSSDHFKALCDSFPAGTLSGTPKPRALELINEIEDAPRGFYGGAIGVLTPQHDVNMAIVIRSVLSKNNVLHYRAGAGVVVDSEPHRETQEVHHKLRAVRTAIAKTAEQFSNTPQTQTP